MYSHHQAIIDSSDDAIISKDLKGFITSWNPAAEKIFGYKAEEIIGEPMLLTIPSYRHHEEQEFLGKLARGEKIKHFETIRIRKDGVAIYVSVTLSPIVDSFNNIVGISKIARDISSRKNIEAELEKHRDHLEQLVKSRTKALADALEQAEKANIAKDSFLRNVTHELRTPLSIIIGFSDIILMDSQSFEVREIKKASIHLMQHIEAIIAYSKFSSEKLVTAIEAVDPWDLLELLADLNQEIAQEFGVKIVLPEPDGSLLPIHTDKALLLRLLNIVLDNAVKFSNGEKKLVRASIEQKNNATIFHIQDAGPGFSEETSAQIFNPFELGCDFLTKPRSGLGLGLSVAKCIVNALRGKIHIQSRIGEGSIFSIEIPLSPDCELNI